MTFRKWRIYLLNKSQAFACSYLNWRKRFMLENLKIPTEKSANKRWSWMLNICRTSINSVNANNNMYIYECVTQRQYSNYIAADECWLNRRWSLECPQTQESKCYQLVGAQTKISGVAASDIEWTSNANEDAMNVLIFVLITWQQWWRAGREDCEDELSKERGQTHCGNVQQSFSD